jgi:hypothetical protein
MSNAPPPTAAPALPSPAEALPGSLQGASFDLTTLDDAARLDVLEKAFDFRGDCTLTLRDGRRLAGYIFDRSRAATLAASFVRLMPETSDDKLRVTFADIARVDFGKDAAHGRTFDAWIKTYVEKMLRGEKASIESEAL